MIRSALLAAFLLSVGAAPCLADPLDVKTGLWEITSAAPPAADAAPQLPADALAKLTPEQRAMVQQRMAGASAGRKTPPRKMCVTEATLARGPRDRDQSSCKRTLTASTPQLMEFHVECTAPHPGSGTFRVKAADQESLTIDVDMVVTDNSTAVPIQRHMQGRWLAADCGSVKPND